MNGQFLRYASVLLFFPAVAMATDLQPAEALPLRIGDFIGVVYYTLEQNGYRVVAEFTSRRRTLPFRVVSTLSSGENITISLPNWRDHAIGELDIVQDAGRLHVNDRYVLPRTELSEEAIIERSLARVPKLGFGLPATTSRSLRQSIVAQ